MSTVSTASASVATQQLQKQAGLAAVYANQQRQEDASLIALLEDGEKHIKQIAASPPPGLGKTVDVSA